MGRGGSSDRGPGPAGARRGTPAAARIARIDAVTVIGVEDVDALVDSRRTELPPAGVSSPTFLTSAALPAGLYRYFASWVSFGLEGLLWAQGA
jgi:hypothetical protein